MTEKNKKIDEWLDKTCTLVINKLRENIEKFRSNPKLGTSAPTIEGQQKKFQFTEKMLREHDESTGPKKSVLYRIIRGFLIEFIKQSEEGTVVCNIENNRNPEAKAYWEKKPKADFYEAKIAGIFHTAASYNHLRENHSEKGEHSASFHTVGEIVRNTIDIFKSEYPNLNPDKNPNPSVYNDHFVVIKLASVLRNREPNVSSLH